MNDMEVLGMVITALITIAGLVSLVVRFIKPINELRIVIQKLNDAIDVMRHDHDSHERRLTKHGEEIDKLDDRVGKLETKMDFFHKK